MPGQNKPKSRTQTFLDSMGVGADFMDPTLPKGVFSHSQYNQFKNCGRAYEFKYVKEIAQPSSPSMGRGTSIHSGIEAALKRKMETGKLPSTEEMREVVSKEFDIKADLVEDWGDIPRDAMKDEALALYDAFHLEALNKINPIAIEKGFAVKFGGVPMSGWIDLVDEQPAMDTTKMSAADAALAPKQKVVVDFKTIGKRYDRTTGKLKAGGKWSERDLRLDSQLTLYAAVEQTPKVRVDQLIAYQRGAGYVRGESERSKQDVAILEEDVAQVAELIRKGTFPMTTIDSGLCSERYCSYWALCRGRKLA